MRDGRGAAILVYMPRAASSKLFLGRRRVAPLLTWLALVAVTVGVLLPFRDDTNVGAIVLVMLLPPLAATGAGPVVAALAALASGLVFNFAFTHPYDSPSVDSNASVAALIVYVVVATTLALVASRLREARAMATQRAREATQLQRLTVDMISSDGFEDVLGEAVADLVEALELQGAELDLVTTGSSFHTAAGRPVTSGSAFGVRTPDSELGSLVVDTGRDELGGDRERTVSSFAGIVALAAVRRQLAEERLRGQRLEATDEVRRTLLQSVSHDLRTPLTAIQASAAALGSVLRPVGETRQMLTDIEEQADRLARLVANLLDLSRLESGTLAPRRVPVPVDELVHGSVTAARAATGATRVVIDVDPDLSAVTVDETMIRQVLVNLLANAARADPDGPLRLVACERGGCVLISVCDHGPGLVEEERVRLFVPFSERRPGAAPAGTGVGLAIARGFVEAHEGTISIETTSGGGATFVVSLPLAVS